MTQLDHLTDETKSRLKSLAEVVDSSESGWDPWEALKSELVRLGVDVETVCTNVLGHRYDHTERGGVCGHCGRVSL